MSKQYNNAGREIVVDRVIELKRKSSSNAFTRIQSTITGQQNQVDLDALKDALEGITSDGIISSYEKQGLRREWASLQSSYVSIAEQFTSNPDLSNNASFLQMRLLYTQLKEIMDKVFADMSTDYVGDDVKDITDGFYEIYQLLSVCQTILNGLNDFSRNYTISVSGNREVLSGTQLTAGIYRGGVEQQNPEFIDGNNYTWTRIDDADSFESRNGKTLLLNSDDLPISPCRFSVIWKDDEQQTTLSVVFEVTYGTIVEYAWSNAVTEEELKGLMPGLWSPTVPTKPDDVKYLWRRETSDNRKTYQYFRDTGTEGVSMSSLVPLYAIGESATTPPDSDYESWSITMPARPEGMYLWRVDKITYSDGTIEYTSPIMVTGDSGDIGTAPEYWYKYTKTNDPDAYKGGAALITIHGKAVSINGTTLVSGMGKWLPYVPQGPQYEDDYLWTMIKHADGTSDIIPPAKQGAPAFDIRIIASQESYQLSSRGVVITEQTFTFTLERWYVTGKANWSVSPDPSTVPDQLSCDADRNQDVFHVTIKKGASLTSFVVSVKCDYMEITRDLTIVGVDGGEESAIYLKVYPLDPNGAKPIFYRDSQTWIKNGSVWPTETPDGEPLITGDYLLYLTEVRQNQSATTGKVEPVPYYFVRGEGVGDAGEWVLLDSDSPYYSEAMGTVLADVVNMPDMPVTVGALYGFFQNFAATDAFIENLRARYIDLRGSIHGGSYNSSGTQVGSGKGVYLDSSGTFKAFNALLRNVQIISENNSGETIFSIGEILQGKTYSKTETATTKKLDDLFDPDDEYSPLNKLSGTLTVSNVEYSFSYPYSDANITALTQDLSYNEDVSITLPYACTISIEADVYNAGSSPFILDIYKNESFQERIESVRNQDNPVVEYSGNTGDVFRFENPADSNLYGNTGSVRIRVKTFPDLCDGIGEIDPEADYSDYFIYIYKEEASGMRWPYSILFNTELTSSTRTNIVYNGQSFDSMLWRLNGETSTLVSDVYLNFAQDQEYDVNSGNYIRYKGEAVYFTSFILSYGKLIVTDSLGETHEYEDDLYAKAIYISTPSEDGATVVKALMPSNSSSTIGSSEKRFDNIYCHTLHADNVNVNGSVIYTGADDTNYTPSNNRYTKYFASLILYSNKIAEYACRGVVRPSTNAGFGVVTYRYGNVEIEFTGCSGAICASEYSDGGSDYTNPYIGNFSASIHSSNDVMNFDLTVTGLLTQASFDSLRSSLGV